VLAMSRSFVKAADNGQGLPARSRAKPGRDPRAEIRTRSHARRKAIASRAEKETAVTRFSQPHARVLVDAPGEVQRMYIGGGVLVLILIILVVVLVMRR
jgi:hypothetical protein